MSNSDQTANSINIARRERDIEVSVNCAESNSVKCATVKVDGEVSFRQISDSSPDYSLDFATEGLIDLQVNGFAGIDYNVPNITSVMVDQSLAELALTGVTKLLPTLITGADAHLADTLTDLDSAVANSSLGPFMVAGYHIEGPFLSPKEGYSGAHNPKHMTDARIELIDKLQSIAVKPIKLITLAPEVPFAIDIIPELINRGILVSIGHSAANENQIQAAVDAGATLSTHLGNGLPQNLHKTDNPIFWHLAQDDLTAMFIADGIHIPKSALKSMLRSKGLNRSILTTDAVSAAGRNMPPGRYTLGQMEIELSADKSVRKPNSVNLAGSSVSMDQMLRNLSNWYDFSVPDFLHLTQRNPRRVLKSKNPPDSTDECVQIVEWTNSSSGPFVSKSHIGPFTINNQN